MTAPAEAGPGAGLTAEFLAGISLSLQGVAEELRAQRARERQLAEAIWWVSCPAISFTGSQEPYLAPGWGPNTGYVWAVQRVTVTSSAPAAADLLSMWRGTSIADAQAQNAMDSWQWAASGPPSLAWHLGRTGIMLMGDQGLVFGGTLTSATTYTASIDAIQLENWLLPRFVL